MGREVSVTGEAPKPMTTSNGTCRECGLVHPSTPRGECPIAQEQRVKEHGDEKTQQLIRSITSHLLNHPGKKELRDMLEKTVEAFKIMYNRKFQK